MPKNQKPLILLSLILSFLFLIPIWVKADDHPTHKNNIMAVEQLTSPTISQIQGSDHQSNLTGRQVSQVSGIVTAIRQHRRSKGFYFQEPELQPNTTNSQGIFVFTKTPPRVSVGDLVEVNGTIIEYIPNSPKKHQLSVTQIDASKGKIEIISRNNPLPSPIIIGTKGRIPPNLIIDDDRLTQFQPDQDAIDFFESLEGMLVQINQVIVVGPIDTNGHIPVIIDQGIRSKNRTNQGGVAIAPNYFNPDRILIGNSLQPNQISVNLGDQFSGSITGIIDYSKGNYQLLNTKPLPPIIHTPPPTITSSLNSNDHQLTIATYNVENLNPYDSDRIIKLGETIVQTLKSPDIIALIEVQDNNGLTNDNIVQADQTYKLLIEAIETASGPTTYQHTDIPPLSNQDGGQPGSNIRVGFLYQSDRLSLYPAPKGTPTEETNIIKQLDGIHLTLNPGRIDPNHPAFQNTRKPLIAEFQFQDHNLFIINNHFIAKLADTPLFGSVQPPQPHSESKRHQQAQIVHQFVKDLLEQDPQANIIVLGDLNDFEFSTTLEILKGNKLENLIDRIDIRDRYTYIYQGNSQTLDHILISPNLSRTTNPQIQIPHINSPYTNSNSDHDPIIAQFTFSK